MTPFGHVFLSLTLCLAWVQAAPVPLIIDTDCGDDMDDSWVLASVLKQPQHFDVKLILTAAKDTVKRAKVVAKYLTMFQRTDVPIGIGLKVDSTIGILYGWAGSFNMSAYNGTVYEDGIGQAINVMKQNPGIQLLALAPTSNFPTLLQRLPDAPKYISQVLAMNGCINTTTYSCAPEYNACLYPWGTQAMYNASWKLTTVPWNTCSQTQLEGANYQKVLSANTTANPIVQSLLDSYCYWTTHGGWVKGCDQHSTVLFDPTALFTLMSTSYFHMQTLNLSVSNAGEILVGQPNARPVNVALTWAPNGLPEMEKDIVSSLM